MKELVLSPTSTLVDESYSSELVFWLNGEEVIIQNPDPTILLTDYLHSVGLTGTKLGCWQGGCGACTVMVSHKDPATGKAVHRPINSCLRPICALDGMVVTTTEGIGNVHDGLDPAQYCIAKENGTQCGFCTPGFVMNTHAYLQHNPEATQEDLEKIFGGNLCRCTGYRPILTAVRTLACDYDKKCDKAQQCMVDPSFEVKVNDKLAVIDLDKLPAHNLPARQLHFTGSGREWFRPNSLAELMRLKRELVKLGGGRESVRLVFGNTASGIYAHEKPRYFIDISRVNELSALTETDAGITVGATTPIQMMLEFADKTAKKVKGDKARSLEALAYHGQFIAGLQVRAAGSVAGNIFITRDHAKKGEPFPSDLFCVMSGLGTKIIIASETYSGGRQSFDLIDMPATEELPEDAVVVQFEIPFTRANEYVQTYRIARRPQMAHPIVNAGMRVVLGKDNKVPEGELTLIFGGLGRMIYRARKTESFLHGKEWNAATLKAVLPVLKKEVEEVAVPMEGEGITLEYRKQLAETFFYKFFLHAASQANPKSVKPELLSAASHDIRPLSTGMQEYTEYPENFPLTQPIIKRAAFVQTSGEIKYTHDIPLPTGGMHGVIVMSTRPHAKFTFTKNTKDLESLVELLRKQFPGVKDLVTAADIPGAKLVGLGDDDPVFSDGIVTSVGAPVAMVLADSIPTAREAAHFVEYECVAYEDLPAVTNIEEAIKQNTAMPMLLRSSDPDEDIQQRIPTIERPGSNEAWLKDPAKTSLPGTSYAHGFIKTPPTAHFYMETNCALAVPGPYNHMTIHASTQSPNGTQMMVAKALGVKLNQVNIMLEQIGGGFGGKQHRANIVASQAAVAAHKLKHPVRLLYDRFTDMQMIGKHHPYMGEYHVAYKDDGKIEAMRLDFSMEAGDTYDCSFAVLDLSLLTADGCYNVPTLQANGTCYRTNKTSNTAFRTFGVMQMWTILESVIERVSYELTQKLGRKVWPEEIREKNMYRNGTAESYDLTHFGQELDFCNIREMWDELKKTAEYDKRCKAVEDFNKKNKWRKRGIVMMPQKHGIAFTEPRGSLNASSATIGVNMADASVIIFTGAVEMGQGVSTKLAQVAANTLGIPLELIRIAGNSSEVIQNAPATAASTGFDLNGGAVEKACRVLRERLENFCRDVEQYTPTRRIEDWRTKWSEKWPEIIFQAWFMRVNLAVSELYKSPHYKGPTYRNPQGKPFLYFSYGAACTEVEIDVLSGEHKILRADIVFDGGKSPNPAIDIGQAEGGFIQGAGMATTEELVYDEDGRLLTDNIWSYKPPCTKSIPLDFRTRLHPVDPERNARELAAEKQAVKSTKAFTESALTLGCSTYFALIHAIKEAREELTGKQEWVDMHFPLTCQRIQQLCGISTDNLTMD